MGGLGSGRLLHYSSKATTDDYLQVDIRRWHREKLLRPGNVFAMTWSRQGKKYSSILVEVLAKEVAFTYQSINTDGKKRDYNYSIQLNYTSCNFGGKRPWFICPSIGCGRRVAILYNGQVFACRKCFKLSYQSQSEGIYDRATRHLDKIRDRLEWEPGILNDSGSKPKGMHWRTFARLSARHNILVRFIITSFQGSLGGGSYLVDDIEI